jgi:5'-nucleotidase
MKLKILYTSDIHSRFEQLARIASAIEELKDENTLILDTGDNADFARLVTEGTNGRVSSALLNEIGYAARAFGNNEGFAGKENSRTISEHSLCPVVTCNMYDLEGHRLDFLQDAAIVHVSGIKVLLVGVTDPINVFYHLFGIHVRQPKNELRRVFARYEKTTYDLLVILSHLGLAEDKALATTFPTIDIIIGGHSHTALHKPIVENHAIICQAGRYGEYLGELILDWDSKSKSIRSFRGRLIPSKKYLQHPKIMKMIRHYSRQANKNLIQKLYTLDVSLDHSLTKESPMGNLLADSLRDIVKTEIGIINSGVINTGVKKGAITKKLLHRLAPSPLNPTYMELRGADIYNALEKSLLKQYQLKDGRGPGFRGRYLGNIQVSHNVQVKLASHSKPGRIEAITVDGKPLEPNKWYTIATSDYLQRGTGYADFANNRNEKYRPESLRDVLESYLNNRTFVRRALIRRFVTKV